ncbi:tetrahydromethanopterin S-methyltransferase subunit D [Methanobrevibacter curvatus]|uniref:Tetrahydromethanopterin S-methyltransferase subunit D n=1 Tax=Methanobrevibacter curvatus TaxID=49547 RepID=A0A166CF81_9EURY|nr:tetrahydromethanopterin S-methyltransferase subunit D [Methanobrevibacter curvatus]KZX14439.1 tetrahydromethanopterin S-methyltransferase subunit D [Methanobrevibacter curvatus]
MVITAILTLIIAVAIGGILIGGGVHFIPVGGAPAAMATATGVGTGTAMLAAGGGLTGLITAASMTGQPVYIVCIAGAVGGMLMIALTMLIANIIYVYGCGIVPSSAKVEKDIITGLDQEKYITPGTEGHGVPTGCFVSGVIGGLFGGVGGGLVYWAAYNALAEAITTPILGVESNVVIAGLAAILGVAVFFINAVIASYNIGGTTEGVHDPKFKRLPRGVLASGVASIVLGIFIYLIVGGAL